MHGREGGMVPSAEFLRARRKREVATMHYNYKTQGVCAQSISFDLEGDVVTNVSFVSGCNGNLKAIAKLADGFTVDEIESKLLGNTCGRRPTSCADQLAIAVRKAKEQAQA